MQGPSSALVNTIESRFLNKHILVLGDIMLDRHLFGAVSRISPEAPVPVVRIIRESASPGGAGNVALNLAGLGIRASLCGLVGDDAAADELHALLKVAGINGAGIVRITGRPTTTKQRIIGGHQQMLRLDREEVSAPDAESLTELHLRVMTLMDSASAVIISDYAKGAVSAELAQEVIRGARERKIPVLVDPKGRDWGKYRGATTIKPNRAELSEISQISIAAFDNLVLEARRIIKTLELEHLMVTLSEEGMACISRDAVIRVPAMSREVFDVSGAGDTVLATLAACMSMGVATADAVRLANLAAGVVIGKVGTVPISNEELLVEVLAEQQRLHDSKVCDLEQLLHRVKLWKARGDRIVFTNGCFDLLHAGHISYLEAARQSGDRLLVGINTDRSVRALKGPTRPINRESDRALVLSSLASVDSVVLFDDDTPLNLIKAIRPDVLVKGADYALNQVVGASEVQGWGGEVKLMALVPGLSTTALAARMQSPP
jgi:D-beta-D-heptose 7-phosphate kinase/D-beta-D-heptose 1-phosphate adenosyltransferase